MKKILTNFISVGRSGLDIPRLHKFKALESHGYNLDLLAGPFIINIKLDGKDLYTFNETIQEFRSLPIQNWSKIRFMFYCLKMNIRGLFLIKKVIENCYDVIYSPGAVLDYVFLSFVLKLFDKKVSWVCVFDNVVPFSDPGNKFVRFLAWIYFQMSIFLMRKADIIFVSTPELMDYLTSRKFAANKLVLTGFALETETLVRARKNEQFAIDALFVGRINETKGIYDMLKVLEIVKNKYTDFQFAIMGSGDPATEKKFKNSIKKMKLEDNVQFLGFKKGLEKYNIMKSAKCFWFLSVSKSESFGIALLEAVCSGIPAFAYDLPQFTRLYQNGEVDISPKGAYKQVAERVIRLFENHNFTNEKGKLLLGKYSWEKIAEIEYNAIKNL